LDYGIILAINIIDQIIENIENIRKKRKGQNSLAVNNLQKL